MGPTSSLLSLTLLATVLAPIYGREYYYKDGSGQICARMDVEFSIDLTLAEEGKDVDKESVDQDFPVVLVVSNCNDTLMIELGAPPAVVWKFELIPSNTTKEGVGLKRSVIFVPALVFGSQLDPVYDECYFDNPEIVQLPDLSHSYECSKSTTVNYAKSSAPSHKYTYGVTVTEAKIKVQVGNMQDGKYGPAVEC